MALVAKFRLVLGLFIALMLTVSTTDAFALNCQHVRALTGKYLKRHYAFSVFDDELSRRTLEQFIRSWDPGKVYFFEQDVKDLENKYAVKLDDMIRASDCAAIKGIVDLYTKRFQERQTIIVKLINDKHDFTVDESMDVDRKKIAFAKTSEEINERWRQRIKFQLLQLNQTLKDIKKSQDKLQKRYALAVKRHNETTMEQVYSVFLNAFSSSLDPHSEYMPAEQLEDFRINTRLSLEGIGAVLRGEDGFTTIQSMVPGGAAAKTGKIRVNDKIVAVAQGKEPPVDVIDMDLREVVKLIRGAGGTEVRLTLIREEAGKSSQFVVPVIREKVQLTDRVAKSKIVKVSVQEKDGTKAEKKIGVLSLPSFYVDFEGMSRRERNFRSSAMDTLQELKKLNDAKVDALVLDLRNNGGGSLEESIRIAGMFIDQGPVVQIRDSSEAIEVKNDPDKGSFYDGPMLVMINRQSASASEILAGAIQDYGRGILVGDSHTFGKGTVQSLEDIGPKMGATKVTISKFYRPLGSSTQLKGVDADIVFPSLVDELEIGEKHYDYALPWEQIKASNLKKLNQVTPYVAQLKTVSKARTDTDEGFKEIHEEIKKYRGSVEARSKVSLKEEVADAKDKNAKKKNNEDNMAGDEELKLEDDVHLQEALRIAGDYTQLLQKRPLGVVTLPEVKKKSTALAGSKGKAKEKKATDVK